MTVDNIPSVIGEQWIDSVCETISWVMRLLPMNEQRITLDVKIEERKEHEPNTEKGRIERLLLQDMLDLHPTEQT